MATLAVPGSSPAGALDPLGLLHDIRGALTVIRGQAHAIVRTGRATEAIIGRLQVIDREVDRIASLVEQVRCGVDVAPAAGAVDLCDLAHEAVRRHDGTAGARQVGIGVASSVGPVFVAGRPDMLRRLLDNLLSNAIRAAGAGGAVTVSVSPAGASVMLRVVDHAPPNPGDTPARSDEHGWGLGLRIVADIVRRHAGELAVEGGDGRSGTCVRVTFPAMSAWAPGAA